MLLARIGPAAGWPQAASSNTRAQAIAALRIIASLFYASTAWSVFEQFLGTGADGLWTDRPQKAYD
jgi:hypothetical protein